LQIEANCMSVSHQIPSPEFPENNPVIILF